MEEEGKGKGGEREGKRVVKEKRLGSSVSDPSHFDMDTDPAPGIHIWEKWIRILVSTFP